MDLLSKIIDFENGELSRTETLEFFSELISSGKIKSLQGSYQRNAMTLIGAGYIEQGTGRILAMPEEV